MFLKNDMSILLRKRQILESRECGMKLQNDPEKESRRFKRHSIEIKTMIFKKHQKRHC